MLHFSFSREVQLLQFQGEKKEICRVLKDLGNLRLFAGSKQEVCAWVFWGRRSVQSRERRSQGILHSLTVELCGTVWSSVVYLIPNICVLKVLVGLFHRNWGTVACWMWRKAEACLNIVGRISDWESCCCSRKGHIDIVGGKIQFVNIHPTKTLKAWFWKNCYTSA